MLITSFVACMRCLSLCDVDHSLLLFGVGVRSLPMNARHFVTMVIIGVLPAVGHAQGTDHARSLTFWRVRQALVGPTVGLRDSAFSRVSPVQVGSILFGGGIGITAAIIGNDVDAPTCAPCDLADLPAIDRWSVRTEQAAWGRASDVVVGRDVGRSGKAGRRTPASPDIDGVVCMDASRHATAQEWHRPLATGDVHRGCCGCRG